MLRVLLVLLLLPALVAAAVPTTNVTGSFNLPSGTNPTNVTLTLTPSEAFQVTDATGNKYQIPAIPQVFSIPASGAVSINVIPNTGASNSPDQTYYRVKIQAGRYVDESLTWQVGYNANGVNLADVDVATPSTATQSFLELVGGTLTGILNLAASPGIRFVPSAEPTGTAAGQAYVNGSDYKLYIYNGLGSWIAATGAGLTSVFHYTDLTGSGTSSSPIRITPGAAGSVMLTNTAGTTVTATALTGDVTVNGSGVTAIGAGKVISSHFADNSITAVKLSPTAGITTTQIQDETLTGSDVANNSLTAVDLSPTAGITTTQITDGTIAVGDLATALANRINSATATNGGLSYGNGTNYSTGAAGTAGQVAVSGGAGAPTWSDPPLSVLSGGYVTRSGSNLLFAPDKSNRVFCFESSVWKPKTIADAGITVACTGLTASTAYYLYVYDSDANGTADALDLSTTGTTTQNGVLVKSGATSRLLIALCRTDGSGNVLTTAQDASQQLVCNIYNKRLIGLVKSDATSSWTYNSTTFRSGNNSTSNRVQFVSDGGSGVVAILSASAAGDASNGYGILGLGLDSTSTNSASINPAMASNSGGLVAPSLAVYIGTPSSGFHFIQWLEAASAGTVTFIGTATNRVSGLVLTGLF